jgi:hypothetical protein
MASTRTVPPDRWLVSRRVGVAGTRMRNQHRTEQCACTARSFVGGPSGIAVTHAQVIGPALMALAKAVMVVSFAGQRDQAEQSASQIHVSRPKDYASFTAIRNDSTAIAVDVDLRISRLHAVQGRLAGSGSRRLDDVIWGKVPTQPLLVRQLGSATVASAETPTPLQPGQRYILFLHPLGLNADHPDEELAITGDRGGYRRTGLSYVFEGGTEAHLPDHIAASTASTSVRA